MYITNATLLINGTIINSLLKLSVDKHATITKPNTIRDVQPDIQSIIISEISMVGCTLLATIHLKLQKFKSIILPFGGINIMFMEYFLQFPITNTPLYFTNIQPIFTFKKSTQKKVRSKIFQENYIKLNSFILTQQMKQNKDIQYATLLKNLPTKKF